MSNDAEKSSPYSHGSELITSQMIHWSFAPLAPSKAFTPRNFERSTDLQFLSPMFTALGGAIFLHEPFALCELMAGCARGDSLCFTGAESSYFAVVSLMGVVLIARPQFWFGTTPNDTLIPPDDLIK